MEHLLETRNNDMDDINLECGNCAKGFVWSVGEQEFLVNLYRQGKITEVRAPRFCKECRRVFKQFNKPNESTNNLPRGGSRNR